MNGPFPRDFFRALASFGPFGELRAAAHPDVYLRRFYAALMVSCLLHAALVFMPYLGAGATESLTALRGVQKPRSARVLSVRLAAENGAAQAGVAGPPANPVPGEEPSPEPERSLGIDLLPIPAPAFYSADQLTKRPQPISDPDLHAPVSDPFRGSGKVILKVWINELGNVISVDVDKSDVPEAVSATAAAAFGKLRFVPGEINGRRVGAVLNVEVTYEDRPREDSAQDVGAIPLP